MKKLAMLALLAMTGCSSLTGAPTPTTGWLFQIGSPSVVHVPVINSQTTGGTTALGLGSHMLVPVADPQPTSPASAPVVSRPALKMPQAGPKPDCPE